jgi:hypothetical protein
MEIEGGCYCGELRFRYSGEPMFKGQCHCRECQYISGGSANMVMGLAEAGFAYTSGKPAEFTRSDLEAPVTREFCGNCGTHILAKAKAMPGALMLKVGTLDDPGVYGQPEMAIFGIDRQSFHQVPEGVPLFERGPGTATVG